MYYKNASHLLLLLVIVALFSQCNTNESFEPVYEVPEELQVYVDDFVLEAAARGIELDIDNLIIEIDGGMEVGQCGLCNSLGSPDKTQKIIRLNPQCLDIGRVLRETLVFHELGHCILQRPHDNDTLPNGDPRSMMVAGNIYLYSPCVYAISGEGCDFTFKREYYLDELFDESTPIPEWSE